MRFIAIWCVVLIGWACAPGDAKLPGDQTPIHAADGLNLLAMGDWGSGSAQQRQVAEAMKNYVARLDRPVDAMLLAGDNFYNHLESVDDPAWEDRFEAMYDAKGLSFPFYATLGNHDYEQNESPIQLAYSVKNPGSRFKLPARWYRLDLPAEKPLVTILMLDSNKPLMGEDLWNQQMRWLEEQLSSDHAAWTIAVAHHPLYSNGRHGDNGVLQQEWGPRFAEGGVDVFICGHDHDLQHLEIPGLPVSLVLCGGGGAKIRPMVVDQRGPFSKSSYGFVHLGFNERSLTVRYVDERQTILHAFKRSLNGKVAVLSTSESDIGEPRTPRSISGATAPTASTAPAGR